MLSDLAAEPPPWSIERRTLADDRAAERLGDLLAYGLACAPDRVAVDDGSTRHTFRELEAMACRLAAELAARGVSKGERVAVIAEKRAMMPAIAVAIWKRGAVYVPLDGEAPAARLDGILRRLRPRLVVSCRSTAPPPGHAVLTLEELQATFVGTGLAVPATCPMHPEDTAYILFTSGSTGEPKGVEIGVDSLLSYFRAHNAVLRVTPASRVLSLSPFHFDVSIEDTLLPLSLGASVYQFRGIVAGPLIRRILSRERITHLIAVSTILTLISQPSEAITEDAFPDLEMVMTGAEVCDPKVINLWKSRLPKARVINAYGPTETTIVCLCHTIETPEPERVSCFPIGRPLEGVHALILDERGEPAAEGEPGELCIGGAQVMRGYVDQPAETSRSLLERDGIRYYRTGDLCYRQPDGAVVFVGRADDEVKIAGRRVHLGEIRQTLLALVGVDRVAVGTLERAGRREIAVVLVSSDPSMLVGAEEHLKAWLPPYMRPSVWAHATNVALSATGKTDERRLLGTVCSLAAETRRSRFRIADDGVVHPATGDLP